jgi:putative transposase
VIKEQEARLSKVDTCRRNGVSLVTFNKLKAAHGGMDSSDAKRLRQLDSLRAKLKRLMGEVMLQRKGMIINEKKLRHLPGKRPVGAPPSWPEASPG